MPDLPLLPPLPNDPDQAARRRSFLRLIFFFAFVFACVFAFQGWHAWELHRNTVGDGRTVESYGYNLAGLTVPRDLLVSAKLPRDGRLTLVNPKSVTVEEVDALNKEYAQRGAWKRIVVSSDSVIGVAVNGEARAYPIRYILWHMIVNDQLGGVPIAVTFDPLCAAAVVFDRRIHGEVHDFGYSGLVYNSNLVMYDHRDSRADESLWSQLGMAPIAGPAVAAGKSLTPLPVFVGKFEMWRKAHPKTTVFPGDPRLKSQYKENPFTSYYQKTQTMFPVNPAAPADGLHKPFDPIMAVKTSTGWEVRPHSPDTATEPTADPSAFALWFAWNAIRGGSPPSPPPN